jgi:predicted transposase YdaD
MKVPTSSWRDGMTNEEHDQQIHQFYDKSYKFLLSSKQLFVELLQSFVDKGWTQELDEANLIKLDKSFILQDFREQEADLVYRLSLKDREVIFYVLLELQSKVDHQMPYRLLLYMVEIWRDLVKNSSKQETAHVMGRLPAIVPIVLYNGDVPWSAARSFKENLHGVELFGKELLDFEYVLIDIQRYKEHDLYKISNVMSTVFLLDRKDRIKDIVTILNKMKTLFETVPEDKYALFRRWIKLVINRNLPADQRQEVEQIVDEFQEPKEVSLMASRLEKAMYEFGRKLHESNEFMARYEADLANGIADGRAKGLEEGIAMGIEEGKAKGIEEGKAKGIEEGKAKGQTETKQQIARSMLQKGLDVELIVEVTGLTREELTMISKEIS